MLLGKHRPLVGKVLHHLGLLHWQSQRFPEPGGQWRAPLHDLIVALV